MPIAHWAVRRRPPELGDRNLAPTHSLAHLEALELRMVDVERLELGRILGGLGSQRPDCVADEAVGFEPVSQLKISE